MNVQDTRARQALMAEMYETRLDLTLQQIADRWGVTPGTIRYAAHLAGKPKRHPKMSEVMKARCA